MSKKKGGGEKEQYYESFAFLSYTSTLTLFDCLGWSISQIWPRNLSDYLFFSAMKFYPSCYTNSSSQKQMSVGQGEKNEFLYSKRSSLTLTFDLKVLFIQGHNKSLSHKLSLGEIDLHRTLQYLVLQKRMGKNAFQSKLSFYYE